MKTIVLFFSLVMVVMVGYTAASAAGVAPAPSPNTIWVSGASGATIPAAGWQCWGDSFTAGGTVVAGPVVVRYNTRPATAVTVKFGGCAAEGASISLAARDAWARAAYPDKVWKDPVVWGVPLPTTTRTATTVPPTRTATRTATAVPPTASRTATRTVPPTATATLPATLRADVTHTAGKFFPKVGWIVWCKTYGSSTNVVMKIATAPFYGVSAVDCGAQTKAPFTPPDAVRRFLTAETGDSWTVK